MSDHDTITITVEQAKRIDDALRKAAVHCIAFGSSEPYGDDPRWSPWSRFYKPVADRCEAASDELRAALKKA